MGFPLSTLKNKDIFFFSRVAQRVHGYKAPEWDLSEHPKEDDFEKRKAAANLRTLRVEEIGTLSIRHLFFFLTYILKKNRVHGYKGPAWDYTPSETDLFAVRRRRDDFEARRAANPVHKGETVAQIGWNTEFEGIDYKLPNSMGDFLQEKLYFGSSAVDSSAYAVEQSPSELATPTKREKQNRLAASPGPHAQQNSDRES